jgi:hypothetical protein
MGYHPEVDPHPPLTAADRCKRQVSGTNDGVLREYWSSPRRRRRHRFAPLAGSTSDWNRLAFLLFSFAAAAAVVVVEDDSSFHMIPLVPISISRYGWIFVVGTVGGSRRAALQMREPVPVDSLIPATPARHCVQSLITPRRNRQRTQRRGRLSSSWSPPDVSSFVVVCQSRRLGCRRYSKVASSIRLRCGRPKRQ